MNNINTPIKRNSGLQAAEFHKVYKVLKVCKVYKKANLYQCNKFITKT